jgi:maltose O-acetyltransferase
MDPTAARLFGLVTSNQYAAFRGRQELANITAFMTRTRSEAVRPAFHQFEIHRKVNLGQKFEIIAMRTEKQKMLAGELYDALDPELVRARERARDLCWDLNATRESEQELRRRILQELLGGGGDSVWMQPPFFCDYGSNIYLGERAYFNFNCVILDVCEVRIGDFAFFGPGVQIYAATHPINAKQRRTQENGKPVTIGSDVWVGGGAIICPGVTIGSKTVIGAGSVVTKNIPDGVVAAGNPCRIIREITEEDCDRQPL